MALAILHRVSITDPKSHLVHVETAISAGPTGPARASGGAPAAGPTPRALPPSLVLFMPVWTPGSYLVREYARNVETLSAEPPATAIKVRKNAWRVATAGAERVVVRYRVYGNELTVRTNHVDETHAFLVGAALFLCVEGAQDLGAVVEIAAPSGWRVATSLRPAPGAPAGSGVHRFEAPDFDTLVDSPIEIGTHREERFEVLGKPHRYVISAADAPRDEDVRRLVADTRTIVEQEARLFGGDLPYDAYDLLLHLSPRGRGGLEHGASAALLAPSTSFATREGYVDLLSLVAHETFHAWNVKRIRPAALVPCRYEEECLTRLLWWFEGGTSYYDWRVLVLARLVSVEEYLDHLASEIAHVETTPGRLVQSLEDASFDAWIKLYRPDENSPNATVSYYRKGEIVCALLDLELRGRTAGRATLDHVLARLWEEYGKPGRPVPEDGLEELFERVSAVPLGDLFEAWVRSAADIDYAATFARVGLALERPPRDGGAPCSLGVRLRSAGEQGGRAVVGSVTRGGAAWAAGIDAGDEILAVGGARVDANIEAVLRAHAPGETVDVLVARDGKVLVRPTVLDPPRKDKMKLVAQKDAGAAARAAFAAWLGAPHPAWYKERSA
ncbi:MAG TPA: PDZ domain-containing protein [Polyangiaceae bacterium]|nr:PDZ domain-containing protein [Polyangiaceae bacterium]